MVDCLFSMMMDEPLDRYDELGLALRQGNRIMRFSPFNAYPARDGWVAIGVVTREDWASLTEAIGRGDLAAHPDFGRVEWRIVHNDAVDRLVGDWTRARAAAEVVQRLRAADVPCAQVRTPAEALASPQLHARDMVQPLRRPDGGATPVAAAGFPLKFSRSHAGHDRPAPVPGADTAAVLTERLGLDEAELARLQADGIV